MKLLGIKIGDHDSNFSFYDGTSVRYHKSERRMQIKHYGSLDPLVWVPILEEWGYSAQDLDAICVTSDEELYRENIDPSLLFHTINADYWFPGITCPVYRLDHHLSHALSIWPVADCLPTWSFVFDGDGDFGRSFSIFKGMELVSSGSVTTVLSFGKLLEDISPALGVSGSWLDLAGKAMGLKSYGVIDADYRELISIFSIVDLFKVSDRILWETITQRKFEESAVDYLSTMHNFAETKFPEFLLEYANESDIISFTGGIAQNSVINGKIKLTFPNCIIPPHSSDDGLSLGCLEFLRIHYKLTPFDNAGFPFWQDDPAPEQPDTETISIVADLLAQGKIVGWFQGRGEVGPRALGNRSILMDPRITNGKDIINNRVKHRETYRPFGASVLVEYASEYFDMSYTSPYMLHVVNTKVDTIPAVTHVDGTSRVQTVDSSNGCYRSLIEQFFVVTGCPVLLNTSLNNNGKPIASTPEDALEFFNISDLDALCIGNKIYYK